MEQRSDRRNSAEFVWPDDGFNRVPFELFTDPRIFELEDARLFRGPFWNFLGFEAEIPNSGDYTTGYAGTTPYVLSRGQDGAVHAFINRCAHRGAEVVRRPRGNARTFNCIYHNWCYGLDGSLTSVTLEKGQGGIGGYAASFDKKEHGMRRLQVDTIAGVVFGTFRDDAPPLEAFLGPAIKGRFERLFERPIMVTGYHRHTIRANWKLLVENSRDLYHAPQLHPFFGTFGIVQPSQRSTVDMANQGTHCLVTIFEETGRRQRKIGLEEPRVTARKSAMPDGFSLNIIGIFPSCLFTLAGSSFSVRQIRPKKPDLFEAYYTYFTYADDPAGLHNHLLQNNMLGPAGYVAMEDAEVIEKLQARISRGVDNGYSLVEMDGYDTTPDRVDHLITEANLRSMWKGYAAFMGFPHANTPSPGPVPIAS